MEDYNNIPSSEMWLTGSLAQLCHDICYSKKLNNFFGITAPPSRVKLISGAAILTQKITDVRNNSNAVITTVSLIKGHRIQDM